MFDKEFINQLFNVHEEKTEIKSDCYFCENVQNMCEHMFVCSYYETLCYRCNECNKYINKSDAYAIVKKHVEECSVKNNYNLCDIIRMIRKNEKSTVLYFNKNKVNDKIFDQLIPCIISLLGTYTDIIVEEIKSGNRNEN